MEENDDGVSYGICKHSIFDPKGSHEPCLFVAILMIERCKLCDKNINDFFHDNSLCLEQKPHPLSLHQSFVRSNILQQVQ